MTEYATTAQIHDNYMLRPSLVNQFSVSFSRMYIPLGQSHRRRATIRPKAGITGLPPASPARPCPTSISPATMRPISWAGTNAHVNTEAANTFDIQNNVLWTKGKHFITVGFQFQALQDNFNNPLTGTLASFSFSNNETANFSPTGTLLTHHRTVLCELPAGPGGQQQRDAERRRRDRAADTRPTRRTFRTTSK